MSSSVLSWIETVNEGSSNKISCLRSSLVQGGSRPGWAAADCHAPLHKASQLFHHLLHRLLVRSGWRRQWACTFSFQCKGKAMQSSQADTGELQLCVSLVLALCPSPVPVCIPGQVSLTSLASPLLTLPPYLSVRHLNLGMDWRRAEGLASWLASRPSLNSLRISFRTWYLSAQQWKSSFESFYIFSSISVHFQLKKKPPC